MHPDKKFMQMAIDKAIEGVDNGQSPFGACIVKNGEVITCDHNIVLLTTDITAHGEINAIRNACKKLDNIHLNRCVIYSTCEPCPMCFGAIYWARPKAIYFANTKDDATAIGFDDSFIYQQLMLDYAQRKIPMQQLMHEQAMQAFSLWKEKKDKIDRVGGSA